ncbi:MAG: sulfurtransferase [Phycisphaerae bacterium]|jgi:adenylyltransferase/sulfurtransferase|nr:sulfurtransferase [Phycisphaerae bacterium]MCZ2399463.1 sulfurtransferase [Phycisphaerae bacterium]NUQ50266.1 sulfurtransferase [Phycisphaerae bacterium]
MSIPEISVGELRQRLAEPARAPVLLDCREPNEVEICRIDGALHIPMRQVAERLSELDPQREIVVYCHHGRRSAMVAGLLAASGFGRVLSLRGGIDAWSCEVDPAMPRY